MPRVSIIITSYNYEDFIGETIESCLAQTHDDVEVIVVDDGSTDNSRAIIERFTGIRTVFQQNGGPAAAVRSGLAIATGEILIHVDSDDILYPEACAKVAALWTPTTTWVPFRLRAFSVHNPDLGPIPAQEFLKSGHIEYLLKFGRFPYPPTSGNAYSMAVAKEILSVTRHPDRDYIDMILNICAPFRGDVHSINECLGGYRIHNLNATSKAKLNATYLGNKMIEEEIRGFAAHCGVILPKDAELTGAYHFQWGVKLYLTGDPAVDVNEARDCARRMISSFARAPRLSPSQRVKNIALGVAVSLWPEAVRAMVGPRVSWSTKPLDARGL